MKKFLISLFLMPSFVIADHCEGGSCPVLEHIKDTGDEVAKDFLPYLGAGVILAIMMQTDSNQNSLSILNLDKNNYVNGIKIYDDNEFLSIKAFTKSIETYPDKSIYNDDLFRQEYSVNILEFNINLN